ncbi:MAG TPA: transcription elongation factor GreA [Candidatus Saccharimonadales bacterium]|nr:transcription elongation factor GreA [Candidatus Saccharimonadales bacterium]
MKKPIDVRVTKQGFQDFKDEETALNTRRPGVLARMVAAREQGDLSENAGYHAAKEELGRIDRRLRELKLNIRFADIIDGTGSEFVVLGTTVVVDNGGGPQEFKIVGKTEANPIEHKMSEASPIGKALMGKKAGDTVEVEIPDGKVNFKILKIS